MQSPASVVRVLWILLASFSLIAGAAGQQRIIKPEDKVRLVCEEEPALTKDYTITKDGLIVLSFIGAIDVSGLTEKQAADKIAAKLIEQRILKKATVTVTLATPDAKAVRFTGAVRNSGETPIRDGMRLSDVVVLAEPTESADLEKLVITSSTGEKFTIKFVASSIEPTENPLLKSGDSVFFPVRLELKEIYVFGGVGRPGSVPFREGMKIREAIESAGGFASLADKTRVRIERAGMAPQVLDLTLSTVDLELLNGDKLVIEIIQEKQYVFVNGEVQQPGAIAFGEGITLSQAVRDAGGPAKNADTAKVTLKSKATGKTTTLNLQQIEQGYQGDVALAPGDQVTIAKKGARRPSNLTIGAGIVLFLFFITR